MFNIIEQQFKLNIEKNKRKKTPKLSNDPSASKDFPLLLFVAAQGFEWCWRGSLGRGMDEGSLGRGMDGRSLGRGKERLVEWFILGWFQWGCYHGYL